MRQGVKMKSSFAAFTCVIRPRCWGVKLQSWGENVLYEVAGGYK